MTATEDFDEEEWRPLSDLSPMKAPKLHIRSSIFQKFDPFASKTLVNNNPTAGPDSEAAKEESHTMKWRFSKLFSTPPGSKKSPNKSTKKNASPRKVKSGDMIVVEEQDEEDHFKEPSADRTTKPSVNYQDQLACYSKKEFDEKLRECKYEALEQFQARQQEMKQVLEQLQEDVNANRSEYETCKKAWTSQFSSLFADPPSLDEIISEDSDLSDSSCQEMLNLIQKSRSKVDALKDACKSFEYQYSKVLPVRTEFERLCSNEAALQAELETLEKSHLHHEEQLATITESYNKAAEQNEENYQNQQSKFDAKLAQLEKDLKIKQFYLKSESEKLKRCQEELENANALLFELQNS